jgi:tetratricopeptide (TPR) repeat protein
MLFTLLAAAALAPGSAWLVWHRLPASRPGADRLPIPSPPTIDLSGVDPAIGRAIKAAQAALKQSPRSAEAWGRLGEVLLAHAFHYPATTCLAEAERLELAQARWPYLQGVALAVADPPDPSTAVQKFERAVELAGDSPDALRLRFAETLLGQDRLEEAEQQFQRVLQLNPANARAHLGLARLAVRQGNPETSRGHLDFALADPHTKKASRLLLAEVQRRLGKEPSADEAREVARLPADAAWPDPFWDEVTRLMTGMKNELRRAEALLHQGRVIDAIVLLQQIVRDYPDSYYAWLIFGRALIKQKNLKAAEKALQTSVKLAPDSAEAHFYLGVTLFSQGNYASAETQFRSATEAKPDYAAAHYNLGHCLLHKGNRAGAMEAFRVALRCQREFSEAHTRLSMLLAEDGHHAEAFAHARLALQYNPADATAKRIAQQMLIYIDFPTGP